MIPIAVYARPPRPGEAKTRLARVLGDEGAAALYGSFIHDTLALCAATRAPTEVWSSEPDDGSLGSIAEGLPVRAQAGPDLGARMDRTLASLVGGAGAGILIGTDAPTLPALYLRLAADALARTDVVLGPAADGGYYLIGVRGRVPAIFDGIAWSAPSVLRDTLAACRSARATVTLLPSWYDVDTPEDLALLRTHLHVAPRAAPSTSRSLGLL